MIRKENMSIQEKKKNLMKSQGFERKLFDVYFLLKSFMKSIKNHSKTESIKICILLNTKKYF